MKYDLIAKNKRIEKKSIFIWNENQFTVGDGLFLRCWYRWVYELGGGLPLVAVDDLTKREIDLIRKIEN